MPPLSPWLRRGCCTGWSLPDYRAFFFLLAALAYGLIGSPTPSGFGWGEAIIALCLLAAVGPGLALRDATGPQPQQWGVAAQGLLLYGLSIPVLAGLFNGNDPGNMLRDMVPFLFLLLPLLMQHWRTRPSSHGVLIAGAALIGVAFGARVLWPVLHGARAEDDLYLSIAPTVVFAAVLLAGMAGERLYRGMSPRNMIWAGLWVGASLLGFAGLALTVQRASLVLAALGLVVLLVLALFHRPRRALGPLCLMLAVCLLLAPVLGDIVAALQHKQGLVGTNMRLQEAAAVLDEIGGSVWAVLFGKGWGATLASPAVGGVVVNFTHSLLTSYWLKTGLFGVMLLGFYLVRLGAGWFGLVREKPVLGVALAVPLIIDIVLYASFKSLDFGLMLVILAVFAPDRARLRSAAS